MRSWILSIVVAGLAACGELFGLAHAADLSVAPAYVSPPVVAPVPVYTWTGVYVGVNGGYGFGQSTPMSLFSDTFSAFSYRIHGTNAPETIGQAVSSGCFRLVNDDVVDLYERVPSGTRVVV